MNTSWKYTDPTQLVVVSEDGSRSGLASALVKDGDTVLPADGPTLAQRIEVLESALAAHINAACSMRRWDSIDTAARRAGYPGKWQTEGIAWAQWCDSCWDKSIEIMTAVLTQGAPEPNLAAFLAAMPPAPTFTDPIILPPTDGHTP